MTDASPTQLVMDLGHREMWTRSEFFPSPANKSALDCVGADGLWPGGKMILVGPEGSGKSHLAAIWALENGAMHLSASDLSIQTVPKIGPKVAIDDVHLIAGDLQKETALFHLHNLILPQGRLLITAAQAPQRLEFCLPDLASRLQATAQTAIGAPDDILLAAVLVKLFSERQVDVRPALIRFLTSRIERSIAAARQIVNDLDHAGLSQGRPLSRSLAAEVLDSGPK